MLAAADAVVDALRTVFEGRRDSVIVYADGETVLHEGPATVRANG
jgi:hypothetical protein